MLSTSLLDRSLCNLSSAEFAREQSQLATHAIQPAPGITFDNGIKSPTTGSIQPVLAHSAGTNAIVIDKFEGRYLLSGGADLQIGLWDLEATVEDFDESNESPLKRVHKPMGIISKNPASHQYGITALDFFPFDSLAFLSSSYDHTLKVWSSETLVPSASFDLSSVIYSLAISPIASHLLVACATQHPTIRLVDLNSGATTHSLAGHVGGSVYSVAWSPKDEHILISGGSDGTIRFWDIRRSAGMLGMLDADDSIGVVGYDGLGRGARRHERGKAHSGPVNGLSWTEDARHVVSAGHDERIRVWDVTTGANTLANFGPVVRNRHFSSTLTPLLCPKRTVKLRNDILFWPNEKEILMYEMFEGRLLKRLKAPGISLHTNTGDRNTKGRVTGLAWRAHNIEMLSSHADGTIRSWQPRTNIDAFVDEARESDDDENEINEGAARKRRRLALDSAHRQVTSRPVTFS